MIEQLRGPTVKVLLHVLVHVPLETVTEYVPAEPTVIHCEVAPVLHEYDASPAGAHNCVVVPGQIELLPVIEQFTDETVTALWHVLLQVPLFTFP